MDVQAARALLGVSTSATAEETRRAYLRLVRQHNPESDPEGFAAAREAFEILRDYQTYARFIPVFAEAPEEETEPAPMESAPVTASPIAESPSAESASAESPSAQSLPAPAAELAPKPAPERPFPPGEHATWEDEEDEEDDNDSLDLERRYAELPYFDLEAKTKFFREAWDRPSPVLFWFTLEKLSPTGPLQDLRCECLRRAADLKMPQALAELVRCGPRLVFDAEMASLLDADSVAERFLGARLLAWREQDADMLEVVAEMFGPEAGSDQRVPAAALIDLALYCLELGRPSSAASLVQVLTGHFARYQDENQVLYGDFAIRWALLRELVALGTTISPRHLAKVARALQGDCSEANNEAINEAASDLLQSHGLDRLDETRRLLHLHAPVLEKVLDLPAALAWVDPSAQRGFRIPHIPLVVWIFLGLAGVRMLTSLVDSVTYRPPKAGGPTPTDFMQDLASKTATAEATLLRGTAEWIARNHCADGVSRAGQLSLHSAEPRLSLTEKPECSRMLRILDTLDGKTCEFNEPDWRSKPDQSQPMKQFLEEASVLREKLCSPNPSEPAP